MHTTLSDLVMAHRYLYYVKGAPVLSDQAYDIMEAMLAENDPVRNSVGSSNESDYTPNQKRMAADLTQGRMP